MQTIMTTQSVPPPDRRDYWAAVVDRFYVNVDLDFGDQTAFRGALSHCDLGRLGLTRYMATANSARRSARHVGRDATDDLFCFLPRSGRMRLRQSGREAVLEPETICLIDGGRSFDLDQPSEIDVHVARVSRSEITLRVPHLDSFTCQAIPATRGLAAIASRFVASLSCEAGRPEAGLGGVTTLSTQALDLLALALCPDGRDSVGEKSSVRAALYRRACDAIDETFPDLTLDPSSLAAALGISVRYLHTLFAARETTVGTAIRERRLAAARAALTDPRGPRRSVSEIATAVGFVSAAHFSRSYKARFGLSPTDTRPLH